MKAGKASFVEADHAAVEVTQCSAMAYPADRAVDGFASVNPAIAVRVVESRQLLVPVSYTFISGAKRAKCNAASLSNRQRTRQADGLMQLG